MFLKDLLENDKKKKKKTFIDSELNANWNYVIIWTQFMC